jgi:hypothetical protein
MGSLTSELREFLDANVVGVLATAGGDGSPRQSLVYFVREGDRLLISTLRDRLKARDVGRTGRASLCVMGHVRPYRRRRSRGRRRSSPRTSARRPPRSPSV